MHCSFWSPEMATAVQRYPRCHSLPLPRKEIWGLDGIYWIECLNHILYPGMVYCFCFLRLIFLIHLCVFVTVCLCVSECVCYVCIYVSCVRKSGLVCVWTYVTECRHQSSMSRIILLPEFHVSPPWWGLQDIALFI